MCTPVVSPWVSRLHGTFDFHRLPRHVPAEKGECVVLTAVPVKRLGRLMLAAQPSLASTATPLASLVLCTAKTHLLPPAHMT